MQADISWREFVEKFMHFDDNSGFGPFFGYFGEFSSFWVNFAKFDNSPVFPCYFWVLAWCTGFDYNAKNLYFKTRTKPEQE